MNVDTLVRRLWQPGVAATLVATAYFQAAGTVQLVTRQAFPPKRIDDAPAAPQPSTPPRTLPPVHPGDPILARNPFDSITGPLDRNPIVIEVPVETRRPDLSDPLGAPECDQITLNIISESHDGSWSRANLSSQAHPTGHERRVGDVVENLRVAHIGFNSRRSSPAVWLLGEELLCQALLFNASQAGPEAARAAPREERAAPPRAEPAEVTATPRAPPDNPEDEGGAMQRRRRIPSSEELAQTLARARD